MVLEIAIWRVAYLMLKRSGDEGEMESVRRSDELADETFHPRTLPL